VTARGVDTNAAMSRSHANRGLDVTRNDASLRREPARRVDRRRHRDTESWSTWSRRTCSRLLDALSRTLRRGAPIVLETINPACWYAFFSSYIRDITHVRPVHPETSSTCSDQRLRTRGNPKPARRCRDAREAPEGLRAGRLSRSPPMRPRRPSRNWWTHRSRTPVRLNELMFATHGLRRRGIGI
jgi:hypothetical protein